MNGTQTLLSCPAQPHISSELLISAFDAVAPREDDVVSEGTVNMSPHVLKDSSLPCSFEEQVTCGINLIGIWVGRQKQLFFQGTVELL